MLWYNTLNKKEVLKLYYGLYIEQVTIEDIFQASSNDIRKTKSKAIRKIRSSMWVKAEYNRRYNLWKSIKKHRFRYWYE